MTRSAKVGEDVKSYNQAEPTSHERAELAERAVRSFVVTVFKGRSPTTLHDDDLTDAMSDLICDLMHYANQQGLDAEYMLMRAKMNYGLEVSDEPVLDE